MNCCWTISQHFCIHARYIVECNRDVQPPTYLERGDLYDLSCIVDPQHKNSVPRFHSLIKEAWPRKEKLGLDESQMEAFQLALTKELAIIQGPPGTGEILRTYFWKNEFVRLFPSLNVCLQFA